MDNEMNKNPPQVKEERTIESILDKQNQAFSAALPEARRILHEMAMETCIANNK